MRSGISAKYVLRLAEISAQVPTQAWQRRSHYHSEPCKFEPHCQVNFVGEYTEPDFPGPLHSMGMAGDPVGQGLYIWGGLSFLLRYPVPVVLVDSAGFLKKLFPRAFFVLLLYHRIRWK